MINSFYKSNKKNRYRIFFLKKQVNGDINIIPYNQGINIICERSFESIQTVFAVVSKTVDKIFKSVSRNNWKRNKYRHMIRNTNGENTWSQLQHLITPCMVFTRSTSDSQMFKESKWFIYLINNTNIINYDSQLNWILQGKFRGLNCTRKELVSSTGSTYVEMHL